MFRNRNGAIVVALVAALALVLLFNPGGVFAQDGATTNDGSGQAGTVVDSGGSANPATPNTAECPLHADHQANGHAGMMGMGRGMMGSGGMGNHGHMAGMMNGMGNMMGNMMHAGQGQCDRTHEMDDCPMSGAQALECPHESATPATEE